MYQHCGGFISLQSAKLVMLPVLKPGFGGREHVHCADYSNAFFAGTRGNAKANYSNSVMHISHT